MEDWAATQPAFLGNFTRLGRITWLSNGKRCGQVMSIDRLYDHIKTEYIFHCEDDWQFTKTGYLQASLNILKDWKQIWTVSLRGNDCNGHPNIKDNFFPFQIQEPYWYGYWGGCNWNPGLRRLSDYRRIRSYGTLMGYAGGGCVPEQNLSKYHLDLNYRIAVLPDGPYVTHLGHLRSQASQPMPRPPKVLIAIPACFRYEYGSHACGIQRETDGRIAAQRETWLKDVKSFPNVDARYFYGNPNFGKFADGGLVPGSDEVFLNVPDDYEHLPEKMKEIYRWALDHGYDYVYKCDDDTFVYVDRLMRSGFDEVDQMGFSNCTHGLNSCPYCYITGGAGYTLSRKAMELILAAPPLPENNPHRWAEDYTTAQALRGKATRRGHPGFLPGFENHYIDVDKVLASDCSFIGLHAVTPEGMRKLYEAVDRTAR